MPILDLSPDELLATTRSARKRLDHSRPVEQEVIRERLELALQAPTGSNSQGWHFVVVTNPEASQALGAIYRLWDIDTIINKALVYSGLSLLLAAVYLALIVGLESLVGLVSRQASQPVVVVVSTLVIAALFEPLRHRMQAIIDRRFYRYKYDAARTLAAFSATLQNEVDLSQLSEQ